MKRVICLVLSLIMFLSGCFRQAESSVPTEQPDAPELMQFVQDHVYMDLEELLDRSSFQIAAVRASFVSGEYLEELASNSESNLYFGHSLKEIEEQFDGTGYVFALDETGETVVTAFEAADDTAERVLQNVAVGSGVILVCVTVSAATAGAAPAFSAILAVSADTAAKAAMSSALISGAAAGVFTALQTGDPEHAVREAALSGSEGFRWGAVGGAVAGGIQKAIQMVHTGGVVPTPRESELRALEKYGGEEQKTFLNGREVPWGTPNGTRPDIMRKVHGHAEAIEVKNYDLSESTGISRLCTVLHDQVLSRTRNLPSGTRQRIVLDVRGRGYSRDRICSAVERIRESLSDVYADIPVDLLR